MNSCHTHALIRAVIAAAIFACASTSVLASSKGQPSGSYPKIPVAKQVGHHESPPADAAHNNENKPRETDPHAPADINTALRHAPTTVNHDNIIKTDQAGLVLDPAKDFNAMLDLAVQYKRDKQYTMAEELFVRVLKSDASVDLHRTACLEMALMVQENKQHGRAQQIFSQFVTRFPDDPGTAEVMLRQGLLYREMGAPVMALSKFYAVMTTALRLKLDRLDYYQRLVLQAQTEIADTYYLQGKFSEAAEFQQRLLKLDNPLLNRPQITYKLIRSLAALKRDAEVVTQSIAFISKYPDADDLPEVRFLYADTLKRQGRTRDAMEQVMTLLSSQQANAANRPADWIYWQQRTGNDIANELYKEGDYLSALEVYRTLSLINTNVSWQTPAWYQMGLVYERLQQPQKAADLYGQILSREPEASGTNSSANLSAVFDMARWRKEHIEWQLNFSKRSVEAKAGEVVTGK